MLEAHDRLYLENDTFVRTIGIPTFGIRTTNFKITRAEKKELFDAGVEKGIKFIEAFDFPTYVAQFREGGSPPAGRGKRLRPASPAD